MTALHFYHLYAGAPDWKRIVFEHVSDLNSAGFEGEARVGLVGTRQQRGKAESWLTKYWPGAYIATEAGEGFEQVTLTALHDAAQSIPASTPVFYAHAKGSLNSSAEQDLWRRCMSYHVIGNWQRCSLLLDNHDAVGGHWLSEDVVRAYNFRDTVPGDWPVHFGGNYWWATAGYLAGLESPATYHKTGDRWDAEWWIGSGNPRVYDFGGGWPFHPHRSPLWSR